jgi:hypothetical protein
MPMSAKISLLLEDAAKLCSAPETALERLVGLYATADEGARQLK